jgi:hypothetical protein
MKKLLFSAILLAAALGSRAQKTIVNDPNAEKRSLSGSFHAIEVSNAVDLYLTQGEEEGVAVSAKEIKYRDRIKTEIKDGVLHIWYNNEGFSWTSGNRKLRAYVSFRTIDRLGASGACDVFVNGALKLSEFSVNLSGASDFKGEIQATKLKVELSGASDMAVSGKAADLAIRASGASDFKGYDLASQHCQADASGASDIHVTVDQELDASASGASDIHVKGNGVIKQMHSSGSSSVKKI